MNSFGFTALINKSSQFSNGLLKGRKQIVTDCHVCVSHPNSKFPDDKFSDVNLIKSKTIHRIVAEIVATGTSMEKIQAVTLVRAVKMFGLE